MTKENTIIYIEGYKEENTIYSITIESLVVLHIYEICSSKCIDLKLKLLEKPLPASVKVSFSGFTYETVNENELPKLTTYCTWPLITVGNCVVAGLSAVGRQIIKSSNNDNMKYLLGFRESCLMACSEVSIWTMFCEVDMPLTIKKMLDLNFDSIDTIRISNNVCRFEYHIAQPVRIHNMYKVAGVQSEKKIPVDTPKSELNLKHTFAEGPKMTISDVILYPCFLIIFKILNNSSLHKDFPLTYNWFKNMQQVFQDRINLYLPDVPKSCKISIDHNFLKISLYKSDMTHCRVEKKMYTKQSNIEKAMNIVNTSDLRVLNENSLYGCDIVFAWDKIPLELNPIGGSLPEKRADRKCQQLESMIKPTLRIVGANNYTIVDFCSGSGHLGLLLAHVLPQCHIILVENKEKSLSRAGERILSCGLNNVTIVQSNLDYFCAKFDVGVSLHACGTATDLVMQTCVSNDAHFVCCPCCYGGIKECHLLKYPRSQQFSNLRGLSYRDYLSLAHGADQTHDVNNIKTKQGYNCMDMIDTDRKLYAESLGYNVLLGKLQPLTCTNKNNVIVGINQNKMEMK